MTFNATIIFFLVLAFRAILHTYSGIQSHPFPAWRSKPPCFFSHDAQSRISQLDIPSYQFSWAFRAFVSAWHSSMFILVWRAKPLFHFVFRVVVFILAFKATFTFLVRCSKPLCQVGVQSHGFGSTFRVITSSFRLAFRATSPFRSSEPHLQFSVQSCIFISTSKLPLFSFDVYRRCSFFSLVFRGTFSFQHPDPCFFDIQRHIVILVFRAASLVWRSEPYVRSNVQSRAVILAFRVASSVWSSEPHVRSNVQSHAIILAFRAALPSWRSESYL